MCTYVVVNVLIVVEENVVLGVYSVCGLPT